MENKMVRWCTAFMFAIAAGAMSLNDASARAVGAEAGRAASPNQWDCFQPYYAGMRNVCSGPGKAWTIPLPVDGSGYKNVTASVESISDTSPVSCRAYSHSKAGASGSTSSLASATNTATDLFMNVNVPGSYQLLLVCWIGSGSAVHTVNWTI